jgi:WD40 repeat protein
MTEQKHLKALIRARMQRTGESYTAARMHIVQATPPLRLGFEREIHAHDKHCMTAVFVPGGEQLISGGFGGQARIWDLDGNQVGELAGHESSVNVIRISADGATAVTASSDKTIRAWDLPARRERAILGRHRRQVLALDLDARRGRLWSGGHDGKLQQWALADGELRRSIDLGASVIAVAVRPTDGLVVASTRGGGATVLDSDGTIVERIGSDAVVSSLAWAGDGTFIIGSGPGSATIWAADAWTAVRSLTTGPGSMLPVALSRDGSRVAAGWDHHLRVWSADESEAPVTVEGLPKGVYGLAFSEDGRLLAVASADGRVRLYSVT